MISHIEGGIHPLYSTLIMEEWKDIKGYECLYKVSNNGLVKSMSVEITQSNGKKRAFKGRLLNLTKKDGYTMVRLFKRNGDRVGKLFKVHVLVANAFIPNLENKPYIDHINTIRDDNRVENLRWCTAKENNNNPLSVKRNKESSHRRFENIDERKKLSESHKKWFSSEENRKKFSEIMSRPDVRLRISENNPVKKRVRHYNNNGDIIGEYKSSIDASRKEGINQTQVSNYCLGKIIPKDKSIWFYLDDISPESMRERLSRINKPRGRVHLMQYTKNGEFIRDYSSMRSASMETGIKESAICNATTGRSKTAGGYIWKRIV